MVSRDLFVDPPESRRFSQTTRARNLRICPWASDDTANREKPARKYSYSVYRRAGRRSEVGCFEDGAVHDEQYGLEDLDSLFNVGLMKT